MLSCTKLDTKVYDKIDNFFNSADRVQYGVGSVYSGLRSAGPGFGPNIYNLNEITSDEIIVPNRGLDWGDNGIWDVLWKHTWVANSPPVNDGWQFIYGATGIPRVNDVLAAVYKFKPELRDYNALVAELRTVRAYYHFTALDLFGNTPIEDTNTNDLSRVGTRPRKEVFAYVENELNENLDALPKEVSADTYGRVTYWFSRALLAKLYLNAEVYTGTPRWADCISACDAILNSGNYVLASNFFDNFKISNESSRENIFVLPFDRAAGLDVFAIQLMTLHYNSYATFGLENGGANGYCSTANYLSQFDTLDERRKMFLVGQQFINQKQYEPQSGDSTQMLYDRSGYPLSFDPDIKTFKLQDPQIEIAGARCQKWEFNKQGFGNMSNDFAIFRLADIILMKAEAQYRLGNISGALATLNKKYNDVSIRSRVHLPDFKDSDINPDGFLKERARELSWEGWRRNDMVRLGHYTDSRKPEKELSEGFRKLFPIPQAEIDKNPYLKQNPGY
jgi:hypothetical protein